MLDAGTTSALSERQFAGTGRHAERPTDWARTAEGAAPRDHPFYEQPDAATVVRTHGWLLIALRRIGLTDESLLCVREEVDARRDPYLVPAAARAFALVLDTDGTIAASFECLHWDEQKVVNRPVTLLGKRRRPVTHSCAASSLITIDQRLRLRSFRVAPSVGPRT